MIQFTKEEVSAIYDTIDELSGGNAENVFSWDGENDPDDPAISSMVKIFKTLRRDIPEDLK